MKTYNLSMLFKSPDSFPPKERIPGVWLAHVLDFDVITQGDSFQDAVRMALEATAIFVDNELRHGRDPIDNRAPNEFWTEFRQVVRKGVPRQSLAIDEAHVQAVAVLATCVLSAGKKPADGKGRLQKPLLWRTAA